MHIALLANTAWLDEELASLHHIVVGLIDESAQVVQVLPQGRAEGEVVMFGKRLSWRERRRRVLNRLAIRKLSAALSEDGVGLIHALDGRLWQAALDLGTQLSVPVVLSANSGMDLAVAGRCKGRLAGVPTAVTCATAPLTEMMAQIIDGHALVQHIPPGVHLGNTTHRADDEMPCVVVSGDGGCDEHVHAMLDGAKRVIDKYPDLQMFFDSQRQDPRRLWRAIRQKGLLANATLIPRRLGHREVLLRAGALVHPQPIGRARSLTLRAMAHAVPVLACGDPLLDYLIDGVTARVLQDPTPEAWARSLVGFADKPRIWRKLGESAQAWVGEHRLASSQLDALIKLYRELLGEPIVFPGPASAAV